MPVTEDPANQPRPLTLADVLTDAAPSPWLISGEQHEDEAEGQHCLPWHVPGNWPYTVIHQFQPGPIMGRGDGYEISRGTQDENNARLIRAAREMAEAIHCALICLDAAATVRQSTTDRTGFVADARARLQEAERAVTGPMQFGRPVR